jgi:hypothetical protein
VTPRPKHRRGRRLLVASIGAATLNYVAVDCGSREVVGNFVAGGDDASDSYGDDSPDAQGPFPDAAVPSFSDVTGDASAADSGPGPDGAADAGGSDAGE